MFNKDQLEKKSFGEDFKFGVSTAAYQIEGAHSADGKGSSIWDVFTGKKGKIFDGHNACTTCDFYNRYEEDIRLIKQLNIPNFRFSISWSRILPNGTGNINQNGIDYYNRVIDYCIEQGIEPWVTLYHWDLPHALEIKGGWTNRDIVGWFSEYVSLSARSFGDRVRYWMVMNEPMVFAGAGYFLGIHAPGRTGMKNFLPAVHHAALAMAEGGRVLRNILPVSSSIGTTFSCSYIEAHSDSPRDIKAATRVDALLNRLFIEPCLGLGYPSDLPIIDKLEKYVIPGDYEKLRFDFDFIGLQNYTREIVKHSFFTPYLKAKLVSAEKRSVPITSMKWEVFPQSVYHIIKKFDNYSQIRSIIITENGAAFPDQVTDGHVNDFQRKDYLQRYLHQVLKAKGEGCKVHGYFVWTLTDNFEWAEGFRPRFGLVHVNFESQERIVKSSGKWYSEFLKEA